MRYLASALLLTACIGSDLRGNVDAGTDASLRFPEEGAGGDGDGDGDGPHVITGIPGGDGDGDSMGVVDAGPVDGGPACACDEPLPAPVCSETPNNLRDLLCEPGDCEPRVRHTWCANGCADGACL